MIPQFRKVLLAATAAMLFFTGAALAVDTNHKGADTLLDTYNRNMSRLAKNSFGLPLFLDSVEHDDKVVVDVYGVFDYPFGTVTNVLKVPGNWCDIVSLTPNVKACTSAEQQGTSLLTFYLGNKGYQTPEETRHQVRYQYRKLDQQPSYLDILLSADAGPYGTKDHTMRFEAAPLHGGKTFVHVSYSYRDSLALRFAARTYFATFGRDKAGFTVTGTDRDGEPVYIGGPRGALERNAVRYYFAIQSYMNTLRYADDTRLGVSTNQWYDLTTRYRKQLYDLDKKDYLAFKTKEFRNQETLQRRIGK